MKTYVKFTGGFGEYFITSLALFFLSIITLGLAFPYWIYWSFKYFFTRMEIGGKRMSFNGHFIEYFLMSIGLMLLTGITFGLALPYWAYWSFKYFFTRLEVDNL
ncbi:hypothetical protein QWY85_08055 [Neolewinella lacunae]|uniref:DUF898 domain-containing protein n=1 Tax=Neolewinella lacunae TaxID=1517758 RepID=A0A923T8M7_9BACT|nr:DUF898 domain-containing protein [Neolewinella lacunae]MBC6994734.1 DUF898 domain-containing protein [Neolewinella lacunae]MDN3634606.1 hypothetical protein [Neolewinella lacunae]